MIINQVIKQVFSFCWVIFFVLSILCVGNSQAESSFQKEAKELSQQTISDAAQDEYGEELMSLTPLPWYGTFSAFVGYGLILLTVFYQVRKNFLSRYHLQNQLKLEQLELEKLQELNEIKERFFTDVSHEFRTPLTLIMSPVKTLLEKENNPENKELLSIVLENAAYLQGLTNQILDISRMEAGQEKLRASAGSLSDFLQKMADKFLQLAKKREIDYQINIPAKMQILFFEKSKIEKVLVNLISNAFKYSPDGGKIVISLIETPNSVSICITNEGEGISEEDQANVFKRFYKGNNSLISTGIGLALTKQLVEMHSGKISLQSENREGGQTTFTVELPKGKAHLLPEQIVGPTTMPVTEELIPFSDSFESNSNNIEGNGLEKDTRPVVLVVEDNDHMRRFICLLLQEQYVVLEARDGMEGYEKAVEFMPEIIVSDVMMPKMNGYELASKLKNNLLTSHIFIVLLTAKATQENIQEGYMVGVESYWTKPFEPSLLKLKIQNLLQSRKRFREAILQIPTTEISIEEQIQFSKVDEEFMAKTIAEIERRISDPDFKVEDLSKAVGFSKSQFYRKLKGLVGKSSNEFIRMIRLKRAAELLKTTDFRIAEITYSVGFNDLEYFRTCFKKEYGMSPTKYRKAILEKRAKKV